VTGFADKVGIVTGGGSGIGREIARQLADAGARVLVVDKDHAAAEATCEHVPDRLAAFAQDVTAVGAPAAVMGACRERWSAPLDVLVNNAGLGNGKPVDATSDEELDRYLDANFRTVFRMSRAALGEFGAGGGAIVNIASAFGVVGFGSPGYAPYSASKAAVIGLTRQMAADCGPRRIRVNAIAPGLIATPATAERVATNPLFQEGLIKATPLGRAGSPADVAGAALYLASDAAEFITGQVIAVDGGWTATRFRQVAPEA
jgi:NAD(P)-dependent dehydrogenase (short-subunit alcohol dehydrogenase family)